MSSMTQGRDDGAHEDELDLEQSDEEHETAAPQESVNYQGHVEALDDGLIEDEAPDHEDSSDHGDSSSSAHPAHERFASRELGVQEDTESIPDDSPSVQGSLLSSRSSALGHRASASNLSVSSHRPFDLRFKTRLSSSSFPSGQRPISPSLLQAHSRNSSLASHVRSGTPDLQESPPSPWEVVRWTKLKKIAGQTFSEVGKRNFGRPTCIAVSTTIAIGTSKGIILVFDYQQNLKVVIGSGTKAAESGTILTLAISADHTTLAAGHADGTIFTWEIARPSRPFLHIPPISSDQLGSKTDGHVSGVAVVHIGFLGTRHTALVSADDHGMAFSHLATRGMGAVARIVRTTRVLGRYPEMSPSNGIPRKPSSVLAFSPLPLGNVTQATDSLGLVAMITPYLLVIASTTPVARTQHKSGRPKEVMAHSAMTAALAWFPAIKLKGKDAEVSNTKLAYCWSNVLTILEVSEIKTDDPADADRPPKLEFKPRSRWRAEEAIVAVQWISRSVLAVMTITQRLLILEDTTLRITDSFDLLHKHVYHVDLFSKQLHTLVEQLDETDQSMHGVVADAFFMSFRVYKGRLFLLGSNDISVGSLSNWADRLLALMESGDFVSAIRLATAYYKGDTEKLTVGLPEEDDLRQGVVQEKLLEMMLASLKYAFGTSDQTGANGQKLEQSQLSELAEVCIAACDAMEDHDFLFDEAYSWYEEYAADDIFLNALEPYITQGSVRSLPPSAVKSLITHFATNHTSSRLEEIICLLDTSTMDIDQVTSLCKKQNLYDAYIYVWNRTLRDYVGPVKDLVGLITSSQKMENNVNGNADTAARDRVNAMKIFPYLSYVLTGRIYPTGDEMDDSESPEAKTAIYRFLFSGTKSTSNNGSRSKIKSHAGETFEALQTILEFDTPSFMTMLNEAFEDNYLNDGSDQIHNNTTSKPGVADGARGGLSINRQYLISILLEIMDPTTSRFGPVDTIYFDMFIARNLPKYPQYILLSGSTLQQVLIRLCKYPSPELLEDCQLSAEYLLSTYQPPDTQSLIPLLKKARFFRILKSIYRSENQYPELLLTYLEDPENQESVFACIHECLRSRSTLSKKQRRGVQEVIKDHAAELTEIDVDRAAKTVQQLTPELQAVFLRALDADTNRQYKYLDTLFEPDWKTRKEAGDAVGFDPQVVERYVSLMCQYDPSRVPDFVDGLNAGDLRLDSVLHSIENSGIIDAAVILLARQGEVGSAMERLTKHLGTLEAGLSGILQSVNQSPDSANTIEGVRDLIESLTKYTRVGIWVCREQTKVSSRKPRRAGKALKGSSSPLNQPLSFDENLWLDLIDAVVRISQNVSPQLRGDLSAAQDGRSGAKASVRAHDLEQFTASLRGLVHQVFTALLTSTTKPTGDTPGGRADVSFLRVLRAFLTRAAAASPSLSELRSVIASIFSAYTYETSLLSLANSMLDKDLFVHVDEVAKLRQRGWRPRGQVCEVCRQRTWGPGTGSRIWTAWRKKQAEEVDRVRDQRIQDRDLASRGKGKALATTPSSSTQPAGTGTGGAHGHPGEAEEENPRNVGPVKVFGCRHIYHVSCLGEEWERRAQNTRQQERWHHDGSHTEIPCLVCTGDNKPDGR